MRYDTDFGSLELWKDSERPKKFKIQFKVLTRSIYEKTRVEKYRQKWRTKRSVVSCRVFVGFIGFACKKRRFLLLESLSNA